MKILQVVSYFHPAYAFGGPVKVVYQISKELAKRGHDVVVYTSDAKDFDSRLNIGFSDNVNGIRVYRFRNLSMMLVKRVKLFITPKMALFVRKEVKTFDIIHLHEYRALQNIVIAYYAKKYGVPYVLQAHGSLPRFITKRRLKWIYDVLFGYRILKDSSKVIALSWVEAEQYKRMGVPEEKIEVISNGIDLSEYGNLLPKRSFKKKFSIDDDEKIILYLGRIHKLKGIDFLIKSFAHLVKNGVKDAKLVLAGADDGYLSTAENLINSLGCSSNALFVGALTHEDKISAYIDSTVVVYPERFNVFGLVPLEAAAFSKPVIVSNENYMSKVVEGGGFGFSVNYGDVEALAKLFKSLVMNDVLASKMGTRGRQYVADNYSLEKVLDKLEKLYEAVKIGQ